MEDIKWLLKRCGFPILILLMVVIAGMSCWGLLHTEEKKVAEKVWEPPVKIENSKAETEEAENTETSTDLAYWFIPQSSDCLISEEEKEQLQNMVLSVAESVKEIYKDVIIIDAANYSSGVSEFTSEQRKEVVKQLGKAVDYTKNSDGTITLIVDGVWPDYNSDLAFRNTVVIQPFADGTFRYLSNSIEEIELELPPIARTKG